MTKTQANLLRAFAVWTFWVWGTRVVNLWTGDESTGFKAVHTVLAVVSIAFGVVTLVIVSRVRRRTSAQADGGAAPDGNANEAVVSGGG